MSDDQENVLSDEAIAEQEKEAVAEGAEFRAKIVAGLGLTDDDANKELIDKVVARESGLRKGFGTLLVKYKTLKSTAKPNPKPPVQQPNAQQPLDAETVRKQTEATVRAELEQRDLDEMEVSDEVKAEIKKVAQIQGVSVRKATQDPYIKHLVDQDKAKQRINEAGGTRSPNAIPVNGKGMPKFDLSTPEGRKEYKDWKANRKRSEE